MDRVPIGNGLEITASVVIPPVPGEVAIELRNHINYPDGTDAWLGGVVFEPKDRHTVLAMLEGAFAEAERHVQEGRNGAQDVPRGIL